MRRTPREKSRNLTDSEMARWREYFEGLVASEHTAMEERTREEREFTSDVMAQVIAELRENIEADTQQARPVAVVLLVPVRPRLVPLPELVLEFLPGTVRETQASHFVRKVYYRRQTTRNPRSVLRRGSVAAPG